MTLVTPRAPGTPQCRHLHHAVVPAGGAPAYPPLLAGSSAVSIPQFPAARRRSIPSLRSLHVPALFANGSGHLSPSRRARQRVNMAAPMAAVAARAMLWVAGAAAAGPLRLGVGVLGPRAYSGGGCIWEVAGQTPGRTGTGREALWWAGRCMWRQEPTRSWCALGAFLVYSVFISSSPPGEPLERE